MRIFPRVWSVASEDSIDDWSEVLLSVVKLGNEGDDGKEGWEEDEDEDEEGNAVKPLSDVLNSLELKPVTSDAFESDKRLSSTPIG